MYQNALSYVIVKGEEPMQEASHHGHVIREYRESQAGITQDELARQVGKSRRTIVSIEQSVCIHDLKLRRTLAWVLHIPPELLGLTEIALPQVAVLTSVETVPTADSKNMSHVVFERLCVK